MSAASSTPPTGRRPASAPLRAMALGLALAGVTLGTIEGVLRLAGYGGDPGDLYFTRLGERVLEPGMYAPHRERFFTLRAGYRRSDEHAGPNALDAWPFRGRAMDSAPEDAWRIAVFGDSCAFGLPLPANQSLPHFLEHALLDRLGDDRAVVANFGVPGYSTVQIRALVEEVLDTYAPDQVVLYPAAWNDQAPSMGRNDLELRDEVQRSSWARDTALAGFLRSVTGGGPPPLPEDLRDAGEALGSRVPEEAVEGEVRAMIQACLDRGVGVVVIAPPHPESKRASHARMFRDAETVRRAARAMGVPLVDEQARFGAPAVELLYFADLVHPAPEGNRELADRVGEILAARAPESPAWTGTATLAITEVRPTSAPRLGDVPVEIQLQGVAPDTTLAAHVGGAALLDPTRAGNVLRGTLPHLAPGPADVVVQSDAGVARRVGAITIEPPALTVVRDANGPRARLVSRANDTARLFVSTALREHPEVSSRGAMSIDERACLPVQVPMACDTDGVAEVELPRLEGEGPHYLQALVVPRGEPADSGFSVWSATASVP